jgi:DUF1009 family protein
MCAAQESQLKKVGIIAGSGHPPALLAETLEKNGIQPCIIALDGITSLDLYQSRAHLLTSIGMAGTMISWLKSNGVRDVVMTGALRRPEWSKLKADPRGMKILAKILLKRSMGDDALLRTLRRELESDGFTLHGIQDFVPGLLAPAGRLGCIAPREEDWETIRLGYNAAKELGRQDKGQCVVVQQDTVLGLEGNDGTKALMQKASLIKSQGRGPILVKVCKPQQDRALDMPTIGIHTVETAHEGGFSGIVVEAGQTLVVDLEDVIRLCDRHGIFLYGLLHDDPLMISA